MSIVATAGNQRVAIRSDDYVSELISRRGGKEDAPSTATAESKNRKLALIMQDPISGFKRVGVAMIGPIQIRMRYQGIVRNILMEDPLGPGVTPEYDVFDDLGQAYMMNGTEGEVRMTPFEGKRITVGYFRIASFPAMRKEESFVLRINIVEQAQDETKQAILKQEDARMVVMLESAITDYATRPDHIVSPTHTVVDASGYFQPLSFYTAAGLIDEHELRSKTILVNPVDARDFYRWGTETTGWAFKDRTVAGEEITSFGEFNFQRSIAIPKKTMYVVPEPNFLGWMPILYSLHVEENHKLEAFWRGWVFDEMLGMFIANAAGLVKITKP